jgi:hypothetical protein
MCWDGDFMSRPYFHQIVRRACIPSLVVEIAIAQCVSCRSIGWVRRLS